MPYLSYPANVLIPVLLREAKVLVQAEANVVAVEAVGSEAEVEQVLLEGSRNGGLARGRETGEPDGEALLLAELVALLAREAGMPGDVAVIAQSPTPEMKDHWWLLASDAELNTKEIAPTLPLR